ncbi:hypothetical protein CS0771_65330 [Catellatospora sp. IY07-71]|nr:hypothetical protein CS0771_65330 [Catellatospora sp. IY07-71]
MAGARPAFGREPGSLNELPVRAGDRRVTTRGMVECLAVSCLCIRDAAWLPQRSTSAIITAKVSARTLRLS